MKRGLWVFLAVVLALPALAQRQNFNRNPIDQLKEILAKANLPLTPDQEKALKPIMDEQRKAMERTREQMRDRIAGGGGGFGGGFGGGGGQVGEDMRRANERFQEKIKTVLTPAQNEAWTKDMVRRRGGVEALKLTLEEAGAPLSPEQEQRVAAEFQNYNDQRRTMFREGGREVDPAKTQELENAHLSRLSKLLNPAQRRALIESRRADRRPN